MNKIQFLSKDLVQKIAAGEVIDRPCSILRELLDNSIDSGSTKIEVNIEDGGITQILVEDNGEGISPNDLKICYKPHTTSKIFTEQDLENIQTLGFRGEALSSISVCANLRITSSINDTESHEIEVENGIEKYFIKQAPIEGTIVNVSNIFHNFPARKRFLKKDAIETKMCIKVFEEKAVTHPEIEFKLSINKELRQAYFEETLLERVQNVFGSVINRNKFGKIEQEYENVKIKIFVAPPHFSKRDKRNIKVFINKRAIDDRNLVQALINGHRRVLSPGNYPICYLFLEINPNNLNFNVHPQKKEVKIFNLPFLFQQTSNTLDKFFDRDQNKIIKDYDDAIIKRQIADDYSLEIEDIEVDNTYKPYQFETDYETLRIPKDNKITDILENKVIWNNTSNSFDNVNKSKNSSEKGLLKEFLFLKEENELNNEDNENYKFIGQVGNMFLITEYNDEIYFIDQHALHEKIIYDSLKNFQAKPQRLLAPIEFIIDGEIEELIDNEIEDYKKLNIIISKITDQTYQLETIPNFCIKYENTIIDFIRTRGSQTISSLETSLFANIACRRAVKKGDTISREFAKVLIEDFFKLKVKHCPHGRKIYHKISKKDLEKEVSRI